LLGYKVNWNQETNTISLSNDGKDYSGASNSSSSTSVSSSIPSTETGKDYILTRDGGYTIVKFNDGFELTVSKNDNDNVDQYFWINLENNSKQKINVTSNSFKYVNEMNTVTKAESCYSCDYYVNDFEIYPNTENYGLLLFKFVSKLNYLIFDDGIHYAEIHNVTTTDLSDDISLFKLMN